MVCALYWENCVPAANVVTQLFEPSNQLAPFVVTEPADATSSSRFNTRVGLGPHLDVVAKVAAMLLGVLMRPAGRPNITWHQATRVNLREARENLLRNHLSHQKKGGTGER
jgi:hypothetical protein